MRIIVWFLLSLVSLSLATEVTWTPNEDEPAPLPLSQNQRQQLLQLEQAIRQSPDPEATLRQVAASNEMDPQELVDLLMQNRREMEQAGGGSSGPMRAPPRQNRLVALVASTTQLLTRTARRHPRWAAATVVSLSSMLYVAHQAPRNGVHCWGSTMLLRPPLAYLHALTESMDLQKGLTVWKVPKGEDDDEVVWHNKDPRGVSLRTIVDTESTETMLQQGAELVRQGHLAEFAEAQLVRKKNRWTMVVPGWGSFGRYRVIGWQLVQEVLEEDRVQLVLESDLGQWHVELTVDSEESVAVRVSLLSRSLSTGRLTQLLSDVTASIVQSLETRTEQTLARRSQSQRFRSSAQQDAQQRRSTRAAKVQQLEEMARDRRRRWQRQNPNAGSYRPSGDRQRSPNNC